MNTGTESTAPYALVVDDDDAIRMDVVQILEEAGFRTLDAADADVAFGLLEDFDGSITLLFTDVEIPGSRNGFAIARETAQRWPQIAIVVASGNIRPGPDDMPDGARFLGKPFSAEMVHSHLREILPEGQKPEPLRR